MSEPLTFVERLKLQLLPKSMASHLASKALAFALDKDNDDERRVDAIRDLGLTRYARDFLGAFIQIATDPKEYRYARHLAMLELRCRDSDAPKNSDDEDRKAEALISVFSGKNIDKRSEQEKYDEEEYRKWALEFSDFKNLKVISAIATVLRDKSESATFRYNILPLVKLTPQDSAYLTLTTALIDIALDSTQDSSLRWYAEGRLDPEIHKDILLRLMNDVDDGVRKGAIWMLNNASIKRAGGKGQG